jgi:hypothetical protein
MADDNDEPPIDEQGVDLTVIRWFLDLTVEERLAHLDEWASASTKLMDAFDEQHVRPHTR